MFQEKCTASLMVVLIMLGALRPIDAVVAEAAVQMITEAVSIDNPANFSENTATFPADNAVNPITMKLIYCASIATMAMVVMAMYWKRGAPVITRIIIYLTSLCIVKMSVRCVFVDYFFNFPKFLTALHFLVSGIFCCIMLLSMPSLSSKGTTTMSWRHMLRMTPLAGVFASSIACGNAALMYSSTSFVEMMSSCTPVCTVVVALLFHQPFDKRLLWPVLVVCGGLATCAAGAMKYSMLGCTFSLLATFLRALKAVLQQILMGRTSSSYQPVELLGWISLPSVVLMLAWSAATEGWGPYEMLANASCPLLMSIGISCGIACVLNVMATFVVKDLGAVGAQLTGQLKGVITVLGGMAVLHEMVSPQQALGYGFVLLGVFWYTKTETWLKSQEKELDPERPAHTR
eukprot:gnl/MRDRNA2_/MRDRNA2_100535_c0_seq1.p1 gnl/MRDRNA2_/MRDRNA2_100535_c0~~gnl/MRDRNA2_/MRDRNA2_100535_c0_seq1.p1  ORF type:complete len:403 (+),score=52.77 gnl/MRDRNA2_/MRDRNA2_100535_c0_seq1:100-1308(+)